MLKKYLTKSNNFMKQINLYWLIGSFFFDDGKVNQTMTKQTHSQQP